MKNKKTNNKNHVKEELNILINNYLKVNPNVIHNNCDFVLDGTLNQMLSGLQKCESPDMYTRIGNKVYILEHFEFDASDEHKGMEGLKEEKVLESRIRCDRSYGEWHSDKAEYSVSKENLNKNFCRHFNIHYGKIDRYIANLKKKSILSDEDKITVGFFAENRYPPYYCDNGKFIGELLYIMTKQFTDLLNKSTRLDFVLFGAYAGGNPQLFFVDRTSLLSESKTIDLFDSHIQLSNLNNNEITIYTEDILIED